MGIGSGIFLSALGAVLAFAVRDNLDGVDLTMVGYIFLLAGVLVVVLSVIMGNQKRQHSTVTQTTGPDGRQSTQEVHSESTPPAAV